MTAKNPSPLLTMVYVSCYNIFLLLVTMSEQHVKIHSTEDQILYRKHVLKVYYDTPGKLASIVASGRASKT